MTESSQNSANPENETLIWVAANATGPGKGTFDAPFSSINTALQETRPGHTVMLKNGRYSGDLTIQLSGTQEFPITIRPQEENGVEIANGCWHLYDVCDLIITGLRFVNAPRGALSVLGAAQRNSFSGLSFINCGIAGTASATVFFAGAGGRCNIVSGCSFTRTLPRPSRTIRTSDAIVGIMLADGTEPYDSKEFSANMVIRGNTLSQYDIAVVVGSGDNGGTQRGHVVEHNRILNCAGDGITVKCGDTIVRENTVEASGLNGISVRHGLGSTIEGNRIIGCKAGIQLNGIGHTVENNCVIRTPGAAIIVKGTESDGAPAAHNAILMNNTIINCGLESAIAIEPGTSCIIRKNLFRGGAIPYLIPTEQQGPDKEKQIPIVIADDNVTCTGEPVNGCIRRPVEFAAFENDHFDNESGYGALGSALQPTTMTAEPPPSADTHHGNDLDDEEDREPQQAPVDHTDPAQSPWAHMYQDEIPGFTMSADEEAVEEDL